MSKKIKSFDLTDKDVLDNPVDAIIKIIGVPEIHLQRLLEWSDMNIKHYEGKDKKQFQQFKKLIVKHSKQLSKINKLEKLIRHNEERFIKNQIDLPPRFRKVLDKNYWELLG